ncbi:hypothetical protein EJ02DRAFT_338816, partial [Clathrospora elynae]
VVCPASDGQYVTAGGSVYQVECGIDRAANDLAGPYYPGSYEGCLSVCSGYPGCVDVTYVSGPCYLKSGVGAPSQNSGAIGGRLVSGTVSSTSSAPASTSTTVVTATPVSSSAPAATSTTVPSSAPGSTSGPVSCPSSDGVTYTSACGAVYVIECAADRYGNDITPNGVAQASTLNQCILACDNTPGCVDVSWVLNGACYMKSSIGDIRQNSNVAGARKISGCTSSSKNLHRKRVAPVVERKLAKRGVYGPDYTFTSTTVTATQTSTAVSTVRTTVTPTPTGTTTTTVYSVASTTSTVTATARATVFNTVNITTCPTARPT